VFLNVSTNIWNNVNYFQITAQEIAHVYVNVLTINAINLTVN